MPTESASPELARWRELAIAAAKGREPEQLARRLAEGVVASPLYVDRPSRAAPVGRVGPWQARVPLALDAPLSWFDQVSSRQATPHVDLGCAGPGAAPMPSLPAGLVGRSLLLDAGAAVAAAVAAAAATPTGSSPLTVYADPLQTLAVQGGLADPLDVALDALAQARVGSRVALAPSGVWAAQAGAEAPTALAVALASMIELLRALHRRGVELPAAVGGLELRVPLRGHVILDLATVRGARRLLARWLLAMGVEPSVARVAAVFPTTELSSVDPPTNLLRLAAAGFAAAAGGADAVTLPPHDAATGSPSIAGVKLAANLHLLLASESMVGRVEDPTAGSYAVEHLTDSLARAAWSELQRIEGEGGLVVSLRAGALQERIAAAFTARASRIARREEPIIGVSTFPDPGAPIPPLPEPRPARPAGHDRVLPSPPLPAAAGWEALRRRLAVDPITVSLVPIGPVKHHQGRLDFARDLLLSAGFRVIRVAPRVDPADVAGAFATSGATIACLCGSDSDYERIVPALAGPLAAAGARAVVVAGKWPDPADLWLAAGVSHAVHVGADVLAICVALADRAAPEFR